MFKISRLELASEAEQAGLSHTWLESPKDRFSHDVIEMWLKHLFSNPCRCFGPKEAFEVKKLTITNGFILRSFLAHLNL